jgi:prepilin-type N-terminal cleavage/methylation domain-containing protein
MRGSRTDGFTLIEMLVVIAILGMLAMFLLPNVLGASRQGQITETLARIEFLKSSIDAFEREYDVYPPDDFSLDELKGAKVAAKADPNNAGIESLVLYLHQKRNGRSTLEDRRPWLTNLDEDKNSATIPVLDTTQKFEVADAWGVPIAYFSAGTGGYERVQRITMPTGEVADVKALRGESGRPLNPTKYQLISAGPDQLFGTDDDLTYPERGP